MTTQAKVGPFSKEDYPFFQPSLEAWYSSKFQFNKGCKIPPKEVEVEEFEVKNNRVHH
jgi:hypothetical protein